MKHKRSEQLFEQALRLIPGGVNSPVRAFKAVGGRPLFISKAKGSKIWDADGNAYLDYVLSWGPMILGHAHPQVIRAIKAAATKGTSYGAPTELEVQLAGLIQKAFPSMELIRMVSSGTEATMSAIRLARGFTGRDKILKFDGCYHGHADSLLVKAGSGLATFGVPDSPGVPADLAKHTLTVSYNDLSAVRKIFEQYGQEIACLIVEPVAANMGVILPKEGFLQGLRDITRQYDSLLIFDEVITGFRLAFGGAQERFGVTPDLTCLGKIIGGGLPVGAYGGRRDIMERIAPLGPVYQAGTLSGNPLAVTAGIETLKLLSKPAVYQQMERRSEDLSEGLADAARKAGATVFGARIASLMTLFFTKQTVTDYATAKTSDTKAYGKFFTAMLDQGIYLAPSQFEAAFLSTAHTDADIEKTIKAAYNAFRAV
ncbi:MAG: glutamate-1-semialdehyde 2,1-aminomutase [Nitrospirae bacterium]|nr:glutamate-1-semialdehyde 2,1-aminomutase [Nitrospirota bacterium]